MKQRLIRMLGVAVLLAPLGALAQQEKSSLEVTMEVVPFASQLDLSDSSVRVVPIGEGASGEGELNSRFGRATAFEAQQGGRDFGDRVSGTVSGNAGQPGFSIPKPPAGQ